MTKHREPTFVDITADDLRGLFQDEWETRMNDLQRVSFKRAGIWASGLTDRQLVAVRNWILTHPKPGNYRWFLMWAWEEMPFRLGLWRWWA